MSTGRFARARDARFVLQRDQFDPIASLAQVADGDFRLVPLPARFRRFARVAFFIDQLERFHAVTRLAQGGVRCCFGFVPRARGEARASRTYLLYLLLLFCRFRR